MHDKTHDKTHVLKRDGDRSLRFSGELLGEGQTGDGTYPGDWTRGHMVRIYACSGGGYVVASSYWSRWQGEGSTHTAHVHSTPAALLGALRDEDGLIGAAEMAAWEDACDEDPALEALRYEEVTP